jgi:hypothetical protein
MATTFPQPGAVPQPAKSGSKRALWIVLIVVLGVLVVLGAIGLWKGGMVVYRTFHSGWIEAGAAAHHFHEELNAGQYEQIYQEADPAFSPIDKHLRLVSFSGQVHTTLGNATSERLTNLNLNVESGSHFVVATFTTTFEKGIAQEQIVWRRDGNTLRLWRYNINSPAFGNQ